MMCQEAGFVQERSLILKGYSGNFKFIYVYFLDIFCKNR